MSLMSIDTPEMLGRLYESAFNASNLDLIMALYDPNAVLVLPGGQQVVGLAAIRAAQQSALQRGGRIKMTLKHCSCAGEVTLLQHQLLWEVDGAPPFCGHTAEVARRQPDGSWRYIIDYIGQND